MLYEAGRSLEGLGIFCQRANCAAGSMVSHVAGNLGLEPVSALEAGPVTFVQHKKHDEKRMRDLES